MTPVSPVSPANGRVCLTARNISARTRMTTVSPMVGRDDKPQSIPPQQVSDGFFRATLRYHRDTASLTVRYSGRNQPWCSAFITGEGTLAALTITPDEARGIAGDRLQFPLPRPLREGDTYNLELGAVGDLLFSPSSTASASARWCCRRASPSPVGWGSIPPRCAHPPR